MRVGRRPALALAVANLVTRLLAALYKPVVTRIFAGYEVTSVMPVWAWPWPVSLPPKCRWAGGCRYASGTSDWT